jgi:hypothetical protein
MPDWRAFRAGLVAQEAAEAALTPAELASSSSSPGQQASRPAAPAQHPALAAAGGRWAHGLAAPERGCLLVARRPDLGPLFTHSVVLVVDHGERGERGVGG